MNNKHIFILVFWLMGWAGFAQNPGVTFSKPNPTDTTTVKINSTFLLLGTLQDYIRRGYGARPGQFDLYYQYEKPLMAYVDSIAQKDFKTQFKVEKGAFISEPLARVMDSLYNGSQLNEKMLDTPSKKFSFLTGVYLRYGEKIEGDFYKIQLANSPKNEDVYRLLKEMDCPRLLYKKLPNIPRIYVFYFQATEPLKKYLATVQSVSKQLQQSLLNTLPAAGNQREQYRESVRKENLKIVEMMK